MAPFQRAVIVAALLALTACDSAEERAAKHFEQAVAYLDSGDVARAVVEFRNVLALDEGNTEARRLFARIARESGNLPEAFSNYMALAEQLPDDPEARLALTEMAILTQNWDEAERNGERLAAIEGDIKGRDIAELALAYRKASEAGNASALRELTRQAEALVDANPGNPILDRLLIEGYLADNDIDAAIRVGEAAIDRGDESELYFRVVGELLVAKGDTERLEAHLRRMLKVFPDDPDARRNLVALLVRDGRADSAEDFLRAEIAEADDKVTAHINLIAVLREVRGTDAALAEIEAALAAYGDAPVLTALKAGILFDTGKRSEAANLMQSVIDAAEPSDETDRFKVALAKMLAANGNEVGARTLIEQVLERDPGQIAALKMQAEWQINADQADAAIATLRQALDQEPEDAETMTLMARAHERNGDQQLARDLLSLAVEASGNAPAESLRLAGALIAQNQYRNAEETLVSALRRSPGNLDLLALLGQVHLATEDWPRAEQVVATLRNVDDARAGAAADNLQLQILSRREGQDRGIGFLEELVAKGGDASAKVALIRARLAENDGEAALSLARDLVAEFPGDPRALMVLGNTQLALDQFVDAETTFRGILAENPGDGIAAIQLVRVMGAQGKVEDAEATVDAGLRASPENPDLLWAKASFLERQNDIGGAIEIYERLYAINSDSPIVANNLASLLATYRDDDASLERAFAVGRRLRDTKVAPFQDTYGWILFRRGEFEEALRYLEPAAEALSTDPLVRFHLAKTYAALDRNAEALAEFQAAVERAPEDDPRAQIAEAKAEIQRLGGADSQ
jgi:predicted Zn-dependent protease